MKYGNTLAVFIGRFAEIPAARRTEERMATRVFSTVIAAAFLAALTPASSGANTYDKLTYMTFSAPVQVPGAMLDAGTYRFWLANPGTSRNVLQVLSRDGSYVYAMFHTTPDSRMSVTEEAVVTFRETPAGVPPAVKSLFYGGERRGYEFVYPESGPLMTTMTASGPLVMHGPAPYRDEAIEPEFESDTTPIESEIEEPAPSTFTPVIEPALDELPRTASAMPLLLFAAVASLVLGLGLGLLSQRLG